MSRNDAREMAEGECNERNDKKPGAACDGRRDARGDFWLGAGGRSACLQEGTAAGRSVQSVDGASARARRAAGCRWLNRQCRRRPSLSSPNSGLSISDQVVPELDISYFFTKNIAAELILGVTRHSISGNGSLANLPIGKTTLLPPTLTLQYHFDNFGAFKPYIGAGVNYTVVLQTIRLPIRQPPSSVRPRSLPLTTSVHVSNAWGGAVQFGFDYMLDRHWGLNVRRQEALADGRITQRPSAACRSQAPRISIRGWSVAV